MRGVEAAVFPALLGSGDGEEVDVRNRVRSLRRRRNPLRRRSDVVEMWTAVAVAVLLFVCAPLAGAAAGLWAHDEARSVAATARADRHRVRAEVIGSPPAGLPSVEGSRPQDFLVAVRWTQPGEGPRTGTVAVPEGTARGDTVDVWLDAKGRAVAPPPGEVAVWQHTLTVGAWTTGGTAALVLLASALVRRISLRHRLAEWERDWALTEPRWTRGRA
ncbi:hypothetical protein ACIQPR_20355 [Streptomyces sp. NPDC091280]|uniref:Rv1733c family protein n=1 Tax=unclassified Streptomyces TaxID=2593676 RepID=UPI0038030A7A